jgi:hypothetical protein
MKNPTRNMASVQEKPRLDEFQVKDFVPTRAINSLLDNFSAFFSSTSLNRFL